MNQLASVIAVVSIAFSTQSAGASEANQSVETGTAVTSEPPPSTVLQVSPMNKAQPPVYEAPLTPHELRERERAENLKRHALAQLEYCKLTEGPDYSQEKYDTYRHQRISGIPLSVIGGLALFSSLGLAAAAAFQDFGSHYDEHDSGLSELGIASLTVLGVGVASLASGIVLIIHGTRGMSRQNILLHQDEIPTPPDSTLSLRPFADPNSRTLGLGISGRF